MLKDSALDEEENGAGKEDMRRALVCCENAKQKAEYLQLVSLASVKLVHKQLLVFLDIASDSILSCSCCYHHSYIPKSSAASLQYLL